MSRSNPKKSVVQHTWSQWYMSTCVPLGKEVWHWVFNFGNGKKPNAFVL